MAKKQDTKQKTETETETKTKTKTKNNEDPQVDDALVKAPKDEIEALGAATKKATYLEIFTTAQEKCVASLKELEKNAAEEEVMGLRRLVKSAQPVVKGREEMTTPAACVEQWRGIPSRLRAISNSSATFSFSFCIWPNLGSSLKASVKVMFSRLGTSLAILSTSP